MLPLGLDSLAYPACSVLATVRHSPATTLVTAFFFLALLMYGEDVRTIAELSIDYYLYPDAEFYNVSGLPLLLLSPPTYELSRGRWVFDNASVGLLSLIHILSRGRWVFDNASVGLGTTRSGGGSSPRQRRRPLVATAL
ncbi:hypothetical protein E2562_024997 [Oryza meyeriana var. granulata]|uniref:Uncharacterized protein n=1 Tax=Oryza meyeriana var. granulata TaxID=110450 RepID=A0A6G1FBP8_9ORYZ|nr:hypothetical protein E2562_024997 [Oryza meyeriana var. granulata]